MLKRLHPKVLTHTLDKTDEFIDRIKNKKDMSLMNFGYIPSKNSWNLVSLNDFRNALFIGQARSGKSNSVISVISSYLINNPNTVLLLHDPQRGLHDYWQLYQTNSQDHRLYENVIPFFGSGEDPIDSIYDELLERKKSKSKNYSQILFVADLFSDTLVLLNYKDDCLSKGTPAWKLTEILKDGPDFKIQTIAASESGEIRDISDNLFSLFSKKFVFNASQQEVFRVTREEIQASWNITLDKNPGCAFTNDGLAVYFPYLLRIDNEWRDFLKVITRMESNLLSTSIEELTAKVHFPLKQEDPFFRLKLNISSLLRHYKIDTKLSNKELAEKFEMDSSNLNKIINHKSEMMKKTTIDSLLHLLIKVRHEDLRINKFLKEMNL